jgi:FtsP/CotA-like multicopper oxidase with cupredoxin domain
MASEKLHTLWVFAALICVMAMPATAQSFRVQCPTSTITHPDPNNTGVNNAEPPYKGPTKLVSTASSDTQTTITGQPYAVNGYMVPAAGTANGAIKCQQISGGDGYSTMADGMQTFMFSFGPLSGLADIANGLPGTQFPAVFNTVYDVNGQIAGAVPAPAGTYYEAATPIQPGDPATTDGASDGGTAYNPGTPGVFSYNGAVGLVPDFDAIAEGTCPPPCLDGHVDPRQIMDVGVMNGNIPAPLLAFDEDDEVYFSLTNVGMIMRPDLFEEHTVHFHGYPNASSFYDGVPDASVAINIGGTFTYYYLAPDAGTYFWHCHITPPEHLQMGMVGQLFVRPRQNRVPSGGSLYTYLGYQNGIGLPSGVLPDLRTVCNPAVDILCSAFTPAINTGAVQGVDKLGNPQKYVYNDGDGSTAYDVEYPLQIHGFDPNFHFVGMTFNPEAFFDMKDKHFLLNGRSYPDTVQPGPLLTQSSDGRVHYSQPMPSIINIPVGGKALLRIADLDVTEYQTLASLGIRMKVVGFNAKLLRDQAGNNLEYYTNSITLGGGESLEVILDASDAGCGGTPGCAATSFPAGSVFYLYTPNLDHLSNDAENFGGLMTEVHICNSVTGGSTHGNTCVI